MAKQVKICEKCKTINDESATFCRVCGAELGQPVEAEQPLVQTQPTFQNQSSQPQQTFQNQGYQPQQTFQNQGYQPQQQSYPPYNYMPENNPNEIYGVPVNDVAVFVGEKANSYVPKFMKKKLTHSKSGFNIIVFLLGFFLSPICASFWFFHRRMNKLGAIILAVGVALTAATLIPMVPLLDNVMDIVNVSVAATENGYGASESSLYESDDYNDYEYNIDDDSYGNEESMFDYVTEEQQQTFKDALSSLMLYAVIMSIVNIISLVFVIIISIFADGWYLDFCIRRINELKSANPECTPTDIMLAGGTKPITWIIVLIAYLVVSTAFAAILISNFLSSLLNSIPL